MDFYSVEAFELVAGMRRITPLGLSVEIPEGWCLLLKDRSSLAAKGIHVLGGVIDSGYSGEVKVVLLGTNSLGMDSIKILPGDRICQGLLLSVPDVEVVECFAATNSSRGEKGFGSSGQ